MKNPSLPQALAILKVAVARLLFGFGVPPGISGEGQGTSRKAPILRRKRANQIACYVKSAPAALARPAGLRGLSSDPVANDLKLPGSLAGA